MKNSFRASFPYGGITKYVRLDNQQLFHFLQGKGIPVLYHANTISTSITYMLQGGLLSRGAVENLGLIQTAQSSDSSDKILNVWNDVFLDSTDLHSFFGRQNYYGPVLFEFDLELLLNSSYEIWITKDNPKYWNVNYPDAQRYFQSVNDLSQNWDKYARQKKMITIRNNSTPILFNYVRRVIVDDPRVVITDGNIHVFNEATRKIRDTHKINPILNGKFTIRDCTNCWCRDNYLNQVSATDLKRLFL